VVDPLAASHCAARWESQHICECLVIKCCYFP